MATATVKTEQIEVVEESLLETIASETPVSLIPLHKRYMTAFNAEGRAVSKTGIIIDEIYALNISVGEYYRTLFAEGFNVPKEWPLNKKGVALSASSTSVRQAVPSANRIVSAFDMRKKREKDATKKLETAKNPVTTSTDSDVPVDVIPEKVETEKPATVATEAIESAPRVESSDADLTFDAVTLIESLQSFMIALNDGNLELDDKQAKQAHKLAKQLIEIAQAA